MDVDLILKVAGIGMLVAVVCQVLSRTGREDQATLVSVSGIVVILILLVGQIGELIAMLRQVFGI